MKVPPGWQRRTAWIGIAVGIALLVWVLRDLDLTRFFIAVANADVLPLLSLPLLIVTESLTRAEKWRHMLIPLVSVGRWRLFGAIMAGYFANMVAPVRVSPLVRAWLVARLENTATMSLLATITLDRTIDGFVFVGFVGLALVTLQLPDQEGAVREGLMWGGAVSFVLLISVVAMLLGLRRGILGRLAPAVSKLPVHIIPARWRNAARLLGGEFINGVVWPREVWRGAVIVAASVAIKLVSISYFVVASHAFGVTLPPSAYLYLMVFLGFLIILAGTLRIVGGFTAGAVFALQSFGVATDEALAMTLTVQIATHVTVALTGVAALWSQGVALTTLLDRRPREGLGDGRRG